MSMNDKEFIVMLEKYAEGIINEIVNPKLKKFEDLHKRINKSIGDMEEVATKNSVKMTKELKKREKILINTRLEREEFESVCMEAKQNVAVIEQEIMRMRDGLKESILAEVQSQIKDVNDESIKWAKENGKLMAAINSLYKDMDDFKKTIRDIGDSARIQMKSEVDKHIPLVVDTFKNMVREEIRVQTKKFMKDNGLIS